MSTGELPTVRDDVPERLREIVAAILDETGRAVRLRDLLTVLGWSFPSAEELARVGIWEPVTLEAVLAGSRRIKSKGTMGELNDSVFVEAADVLGDLVDEWRASAGLPVAEYLEGALLRALRQAESDFEETASSDILGLRIVRKKGSPPPVRGDLLAVPAKGEGYHPAVVIGHDYIGMAVGLFADRLPLEEVADGTPSRAFPRAVHLDVDLVRRGIIKAVGRGDWLLARFPNPPEVYHSPEFAVDVDAGEFGIAETSDGRYRLLTEVEAREVGLLDDTYDSLPHLSDIQRWLARM